MHMPQFACKATHLDYHIGGLQRAADTECYVDHQRLQQPHEISITSVCNPPHGTSTTPQFKTSLCNASLSCNKKWHVCKTEHSPAAHLQQLVLLCQVCLQLLGDVHHLHMTTLNLEEAFACQPYPSSKAWSIMLPCMCSAKLNTSGFTRYADSAAHLAVLHDGAAAAVEGGGAGLQLRGDALPLPQHVPQAAEVQPLQQSTGSAELFAMASVTLQPSTRPQADMKARSDRPRCSDTAW